MIDVSQAELVRPVFPRDNAILVASRRPLAAFDIPANCEVESP